MERSDVGCDLVQVRCNSSRVQALLTYFSNNSNGSDHYYPGGAQCLRQQCSDLVMQQEWQQPSESVFTAPQGTAMQAVAAGGALCMAGALLAARLWSLRPPIEDSEEDELLCIE